MAAIDSSVLHQPAVGPTASPKSYALAVILSSVVGWLGVHLFYLGRPGLAFLDVGLSIGWIVALALGHGALAVVLLALDVGHALLVTIQLLVGGFEDGQGRIVCYPGQRLPNALDRREES